MMELKRNPGRPAKTTAPAQKKKKKKQVTISTHKRPDRWSNAEWQYALRKQFGETELKIFIQPENPHSLFTTYVVTNQETNNVYHVCLRGETTDYTKYRHNTLTKRNNSCDCIDFRTNRLGICKHISGVVASMKKQRGVRTMLKNAPRPEQTTLYVDYTQQRMLRLCVGTTKERNFLKWMTTYFDEEGIMLKGMERNFEQLLQEARAISPTFTCEADALDLVLEQRDKLQLAKLIGRKMGKNPLAAVAQVLKVQPYPYQVEGIVFAASVGRALIADEMGLGKTLQAIGVAELYKKHLGISRVLVVCPTTLKFQWQKEIEKFASSSAQIIQGIATTRRVMYGASEAFYQIASYHTLIYDAETISKAHYDLVIFDEAQRMKNFRTKIAAAVRKIHTTYALVLTGTPIENRLEELYSLTQLVDQYKLPPLYQFVERYQMQNETGKVVGFQHLKEIGTMLSDCMIRRTKKQVLDQMPTRQDKVLFVPMTKEQRIAHDESGFEVSMIVAKWVKQHFLTETDRRKLMIHLMMMRMACDSTFLIDQKTRHETKINELFCILEEALTDPEQKVVIFSQWERMTRIVAQEADERGIGYVSLHGSVPGDQRGALIEQFHNDPECRLFLSTDAGGVGLNLQCANLMINLDLPWNPGVLEQRIGRIYRLGQSKNVTVINMVAEATIESRMLVVLNFKKDMALGVLDPEGEDVIFMDENRLKKFMESLAVMNSQTNEPQMDTEYTEPEPDMGVADLEHMPNQVASVQELLMATESTENARPPYTGDDDVRAAQPPAHTQPHTLPEQNLSEPQQLLSQGLSFLSKLSETLAHPEKTKDLVESITETDTQTGQTYLKIPIENEAVIGNAVKLLGNLFAQLAK